MIGNQGSEEPSPRPFSSLIDGPGKIVRNFQAIQKPKITPLFIDTTKHTKITEVQVNGYMVDSSTHYFQQITNHQPATTEPSTIPSVVYFTSLSAPATSASAKVNISSRILHDASAMLMASAPPVPSPKRMFRLSTGSSFI